MRAHISQEELSFRSGLSKIIFLMFERGTRNISLKLFQISRWFEVEVKELFNFLNRSKKMPIYQIILVIAVVILVLVYY